MAEQVNPVPTAHPSAATPLAEVPQPLQQPRAAPATRGAALGRPGPEATSTPACCPQRSRSAVGAPPYRDSLPIPPAAGNRRPSEPRAGEPDRLGECTALGTPGKEHYYEEAAATVAAAIRTRPTKTRRAGASGRKEKAGRKWLSPHSAPYRLEATSTGCAKTDCLH